MSATPHVTNPTDALPSAATPEEIDASCRWPVMFLAAKSGAWLFLASIFGLLASVKMHGPAFLSGSAWLTYGRVYPAATTMFVYGFALQAGLAVGLWVLCRVCRVKLAGAGVIVAALALWNFGVFWGVGNILAGNSSGFEGVELVRSSLDILLVAWIIIGAAGLLTFARRAERQIYAAGWFVVAALFVFPWIAASACLLLHVAPVRGTVQALVAWWFVANLHWLVLGFLALAAIFYFVPKLSGKPLHSHYSALFVFWMVLLFAPWVGVPVTAPVPAWLPALSGVMSVFLLLPAIALVNNLWQTLAGPSKLEAGVDKTALRFVTVAGFAFAVALVMLVLQSVRPTAELLQLTLFTAAQKQIALYGFVAMGLLGSLYAILPRVTGRELPLPEWPTSSFLFIRGQPFGIAQVVRTVDWSFGLLLAAVIIWGAALALGGYQQGQLLSTPDGFPSSVTKYLTFLRVSTLADCILVPVSFLFFWNANGLACHAIRQCLKTVLAEKPAVEPVAKGARA